MFQALSKKLYLHITPLNFHYKSIYPFYRQSYESPERASNLSNIPQIMSDSDRSSQILEPTLTKHTTAPSPLFLPTANFASWQRFDFPALFFPLRMGLSTNSRCPVLSGYDASKKCLRLCFEIVLCYKSNTHLSSLFFLPFLLKGKDLGFFPILALFMSSDTFFKTKVTKYVLLKSLGASDERWSPLLLTNDCTSLRRPSSPFSTHYHQL